MEKKQCVIRTWPYGYNEPLTDLQNKLSEGWLVIMVNPITDKNGVQCNDYILEKTISKALGE